MKEIPWKAFEEVEFNNSLVLRWIREGDEYVLRMTKEQLVDFKKLNVNKKVLPLFTEEIMNLWMYASGAAEALQGTGKEVNLPEMFARAIEEMHGIKE